MKKSGFFVLLAGALMSIIGCAGYFNPDSTAVGGARPISELRIGGADGDFLSSDTANDISPYLYHPTNGGDSYLFFASDRSGNYDIYYAKQTGDYFEAPRALGAEFNTADDEMFPVVFEFITYPGEDPVLNLALAFYHKNSGEIVLCTNLTVNNGVITGNNFDTAVAPSKVEGLSVMIEYGELYIYGYDGTTNSYVYPYYIGSEFGSPYTNSVIDMNIYSISTLDVAMKLPLIYSVDELISNISLTETVVNGFHQISAYALLEDYSYSYGSIPSYSSYGQGFNDKNPFIDAEDGTKVYFASDRYEASGDYYDLYRYNDKTIAGEVFGINGDYQPTAVYVDVNNGSINYTGYYKDYPAKNIDDAVSSTYTLDIENVYVAQGEYTPGNGLSTFTTGLSISAYGLNIVGGWDSGFSAVTGYTAFNGQNKSNYNLVQFYGENTMLKNFIFKGGTGTGIFPGGLYVYGISNRIENCIITGNSNTTGNGGGIKLNNAYWTVITNTVVSNNFATNGGGLSIENSTDNSVYADFIGNQAVDSGGGVVLTNAQLNYISSLFFTNVAIRGGGMYIDGGSTNNTINSDFISNFANRGGGIYSYPYGYENNIIINETNGNNTNFFEEEPK